MARIKDTSVEAVKSSAEILPLVEDYVRLRKAGGTYKGLCPFHQEKTPSFTVTPARGTFKCFGCGEGGDAISFVERLENVDFVGAIEHLAKRFGVEIEYEEISPEADRARRQKERLGQLLERATLFYERLLWESDQAAFVREYLASRGLGDEVCRQFRLGYAPGGPTLTGRAAQEGFGGDELLAAGLANRRGNDYFNRRLLFPLTDARGNVRGFQARKLHDDDPLQAKYVNSPESDVFKKGDLLYGLDSGRQAIAKQDRAVVVEGNTDVLALRQAGFEPVVASMGTALTERQLRELNRLTKRLFLCFDSDAAGQDATLRGHGAGRRAGFRRPDRHAPEGHRSRRRSGRVRAAPPLAGELSGASRAALEHERARDKQSAFAAIRTFLASVPDSPERQDALRLAADLLDLPPETQAGLAPARGSSRPPASSLLACSTRGSGSSGARSPASRRTPSSAASSRSSVPEQFDHELHRRARAHLLGEEPADGELTPLLAELYALAESEEHHEQTAKQLLLRLRERELQRELAARGQRPGRGAPAGATEVRTAIREFA